ncbi:MAG TPA: hypothetical protein VMD97_10500 [Candidatus Aquilonibacter sp.]|nr:hypothetical protein [Candidatus Aquilonibacter sp.]
MQIPKQIHLPAVVPLLLALLCPAVAGAVKVHTVALGAARKVPYTPPEATSDTKDDDATSLRIRPLLVDSQQREWTVGPIHEVTDRTFVVQRAMHINDGLPNEPVRWSWQPGPWLMVDRVTGHITALHLPDFDPQVSEVVWFRDYAAYCGIATTARGGLMAVIAELGARKAVVQQKLSAWPIANAPHPVCEVAKWQRTPMRATLQQTGGQPMTFDVVGVSSLIEDGESGDD